MKIIAWNTNRMYTPGGQKMAATVRDGICSWVDVSRHLEGEFEARRQAGSGYADWELKEIVEYLYDRNLGRSGVTDKVALCDLVSAALEVPDA